MRQITIDFTSQLHPLCAGYIGEHNATEITVVRPADLSGVMYSLAFMTNGEVIHSKYFSADEEIKIALWQQLTLDNDLYVQLEAFDENGDYLGKSTTAKLVLSNSVHGTDVIADADNPDVYSEIALNTWLRETLEDNVDTLDKLTTSENGELLFDGNPIESGNNSSGGLSKEQLADLTANTKARHTHSNKNIVLDKLDMDVDGSHLYVIGKGTVAYTSDIPPEIPANDVSNYFGGQSVRRGYVGSSALETLIDIVNNKFATKDVVEALGNPLTIELVDTLPEAGEEGTIYLVPSGGIEANIYEEYLFVNGVAELIGSTQIDLSDYYTKEEIDEKGFISSEENLVKYIDSVTFGVEEIAVTDNIVTLGTGWSGNVADGFTHASGSVEPLEIAINANDGEKFIIEYNTSVTGNYILLKLGSAESIENVYPTSPYNGTTAIQWGLVCSGDNGVLQIIPTNDFTGTITNIKIYKITKNGEKEITVDLDNVGIGQLPNHIAGFYNFYLSPTSMQKSVNGTRNVAIGYASLRDIVSGGRNIGLGTFTLASLIYGENNIGIGADAGLNLTLAENLVAIGKGAAAFGSKRTDDIAIGRYSLSGSKGTENTTKNVAIGVEAGRDCASSGNVFVGTSAGAKVTNSNNNVIIGNGAGNKITTGWGNTIIGASANANASNTRTTVIGQGAVATKNYQAVLGGDYTTETVLKGDLIARGTDGVYRQIVFNADGSCSWVETTI